MPSQQLPRRDSKTQSTNLYRHGFYKDKDQLGTSKIFKIEMYE